ncbi:MAG: uL15 family ribosomal protein [Candidatus Diapherotrites archaeon]|nr:uL15 family ribosomal protein [Candidatus Diapherotrites archaeon]
MPQKKRKIRVGKQLGTRTVGRGRKGSRKKGGGRGLAGSSKHKFSWILKNKPDHFGAESMTGAKKPKAVNVGYLNELAVTKGKDELNAASLGFGKVLGSGEVTRAITVKAKLFTAKAKEKIEAAGGQAVTV